MTYLLRAPVQFEETIKKSRFLTQVVPLASSAEAADKIAALSTHNASHNCWAWKVGDEYRFSDDGEPSGTAGRPMLAAIENHEFDKVLAVCTRWYGGIQLGTGGLARAYGNGVIQCLKAAPKERFVPRQRMVGHCPYSEVGQLQALLIDMDVVIENEDFNESGCTFTIASPLECVEACQDILQQITSGAYSFKKL